MHQGPSQKFLKLLLIQFSHRPLKVNEKKKRRKFIKEPSRVTEKRYKNKGYKHSKIKGRKIKKKNKQAKF